MYYQYNDKGSDRLYCETAKVPPVCILTGLEAPIVYCGTSPAMNQLHTLTSGSLQVT